MRAIKKTIKTTTVSIFRLDMDTLQAVQIATVEHVGGLGERLAVSRAKKEYGNDVICKVEDSYKVYSMPGETFLKYATVCDDEPEAEELAAE